MTDDKDTLIQKGGVTDVTGERGVDEDAGVPGAKRKAASDSEAAGPDDGGPAGEQGSGAGGD